ncbi:MAG: DsbC family protein [Gammaproteobacteria bacterium]|nr:MAG: DsbC family protein [Gammaproteobacteria bacterium]
MLIPRRAALAVSLLLLGTASPAPADEASGKANADDARAAIFERFPELDADSVRPTPIPGLYELSLGGHIAYISADARYLLQGDLYDIDSEANLTEGRRSGARLAAIQAVPESSMIIFGSASLPHTVTVFTDVDCGYCRKLHRQIADYNAEGIRVRYLFFPRSGPDTPSWFKAEQVWCSADRNDALTRAKAGQVIQSEDCGPTPVERHYRLGQSLGIRGTPAIVTERGELIPGYVSPPDLLEYLESDG